MKTNALSLLLLVFILSLFSACQEEDTTITDRVVPDDEPVLWENILEGQSESRQDLYNCGVQGEMLTVTGRTSRGQILADGTVREIEIWPTSRTIERRNAISSQFLTSSHTWEDRTALFIYHTSTTIGDTHLFLRFPDHPDLPGSLFANFEDFNFAEEDAAINDQRVVLLPLRSRTQPNRPALAQFALEDPAGDTYPIVTIDTSTFREILLPPDPNPAFVRLQALNGDFFVSTGYRSYRILSDGSYQELLDEPALEFFRFQEDYYAYTSNALHRSIDGGATWTEIEWPHDLRFFTVADQLFAFQNNRIYRIDPADFSLTRIHEGQLTDVGIRAVCIFAGHVYFATSRGLYRVATEDFLDLD